MKRLTAILPLLVPLLTAGLAGFAVNVYDLILSAHVCRPALYPFVIFVLAATCFFIYFLRKSVRAARHIYLDGHQVRLPLFAHMTFSAVIGLSVGFACSGIFSLFADISENALFCAINTPGFYIFDVWLFLGLPFPAGDAGWSMYPWAIVAQWLLTGLIVGGLLRLKRAKTFCKTD